MVSFAVVVLALTAVLPAVALADSFTVTSGDLHFDTGDPPIFNLNGAGFQLGGVVTGGQWSGFPDMAACGFNCLGGTVTHLGSTFGGPTALAAGSAVAFGGGTVNGVTFDNPAGPDVWYFGVLSFDTPAVTLGDGNEFYTAPFAFTGRLQGFPTADGTGPPLFDLPLTGQGDATLRTSFNASTDRYSFVSMQYAFKDTAVTPEPASMVLVGSGLAIAGVLRRRRRNRKPPTGVAR